MYSTCPRVMTPTCQIKDHKQFTLLKIQFEFCAKKNTEKETQTLTHVTHNTNKWRSFTLKQQNKGGLTLVWNKWRDYSLPLRQQYLVMSPGASRERVKSQGVKVEPSNLHHSSSWWRREKRKLDCTVEQLEHGGGLRPGLLLWWIEDV